MSTDTQQTDYRPTVLLPKTDFPQKANLAQREPEILKRWDEGSYAQRAQEREGRPEFVLHDGPPYANGDIHVGHALNKSLKDIVVRMKTMTGHRARYVPGWDCHGLPIEQKVVEELQKKKEWGSKSPVEVRHLCAAYAEKWKNTQRDQFRRLGCWGDWQHPYMTLQPQFEVEILRALKVLNERGFIYRGLKCVLWDPVFETALAEAEIEYNEAHVSPSIHVRFPFREAPAVPELAGGSVVIWTTTPWTLPGNLAVSLHPEFDYVAYRVEGEVFCVAAGLLDAFKKETGLEGGEVLATFKAKALEKARLSHPIFEDRDSVVLLGEHVNLEQGTGCVHTAPGHGAEDMDVCRKYGIEPFCPVDARGRYTEDFPDMKGEFVFQANPKIVERLRAAGRLVHESKITHSYPYSWRSRKPVITRATEQWFVAVDKDGLRERALAECDRVNWVPSWGYERIIGMLKSRPDWCISRQRSWGVPIPSLHDKVERRSFLDGAVVDRVMEHVAKEGVDAWFIRPVEDFLTPELAAKGPGRYEKEFNILDVWFESGTSHLAVLNDHHKLSWPADLYLEGADQHRGWFQTSLWVSLGVKDRAPFKTVLTHGFVLDEKGQAMSKSLGNVINPLDVIKDYGADVLRMWVASEDYSRDLNLSKNMLEQVAGVYRRYRNTLRFLLGNLHDFTPGRDSVGIDAMDADDRWLLHRLNALVEKCRGAYEQYQFHTVYHAVNEFCVTELGALYLDMSKDRLYCSAAGDRVRRAAQTVMFEAASVLARLFAPIVPFTTEEAWGYMPSWPGKDESVHFASMPEPNPAWRNDALAAEFAVLLAVREAANRQLEEMRRAKTIGTNSDAMLEVEVDPGPLADRLAGDEAVRRLLLVSQVEVTGGAPAMPEPELEAVGVKVRLKARPAKGKKCARCWRHFEDVGSDPAHPSVCSRCADAVRRMN